jgi:dolichol kinase
MLPGVEIRRKLVHLSSLAFPIGYSLTSRETVLWAAVPLFLGFLAADLLRRCHGWTASVFERYFLGTVLRERERTALMGSTYFLFSTILTVCFFSKPVAIASLFILVISDTCAAWVGRGIGRIRFSERKTLEGSLAFLVSALAIVWLTPGIGRVGGVFAAVVATIAELLPWDVDDNLTLPLVAGAVMSFVAG